VTGLECAENDISSRANARNALGNADPTPQQRPGGALGRPIFCLALHEGIGALAEPVNVLGAVRLGFSKFVGSGLVDPHGGGQRWRFGLLADEPFGTGGVGAGENLRTGLLDESGTSCTSAGVCNSMPVAVRGVVPAETPLAERARVAGCSRTGRGSPGAVLQRFEPGLGVGVVLGAVGSGVGLGHPEVGQQQRNGFETIEVPRAACTVGYGRLAPRPPVSGLRVD